MSNRRRSERFTVALPVTLKDSKGGEETQTANVSSHGLAVFTRDPRPLRQYLELELMLPEQDHPVCITAVVARHADNLDLGNGTEGPGLGLDFFLFDARAKQAWSNFLYDLNVRGVSQVAPLPPLSRMPPQVFDDTPTFIIKPRDLGRLWAFYRGEMTKGRVRIETPILKPVGTLVELLVVHPTSQAEWVLEGHVATSTDNARGGRPVLEIELDRLDGDLKSAFRNFVATGHGMIEEDISMSMEIPSMVPSGVPISSRSNSAIRAPSTRPPSQPASGEMQRLKSVVIDLDNLGDEEMVPEIVDPPPMLADDQSEESTLDGEPAQELVPYEEADEEEPTLTPASPEVRANPALARAIHISSEAPTPDPSAAPPQVADERETEPEPVLEEPPRLTNQHLFSAFFEEAQEAEALKSQMPKTPPPAESTRRVRPPSVPIAPSVSPVPPVDDLTPPRTGLRIIPRGLVRAQPMQTSGTRPPPPPLPTDDEPLNPLPEPNPIPVVRGAPELPMGEMAPQIRGVSEPPPIPLEEVVEEIEEIEEIEEVAPLRHRGMVEFTSEQLRANMPPPPPPPSRQESALPPSARRRAREIGERQRTNVHHTNYSTAGLDPSLDRDIALARARVVRSPNSVTACYRLSMLLLQRGTEPENLDDALESLRRVLELEPNHPGGHHRLAELFARKGNYIQAAEHLNRARRLGYRTDPDLEAIVAQGIKTT